MANYSSSEIEEILLKLSQAPAPEVKLIKFERLGVLVNVPKKEEGLKDGEDVSLLLNCSVCKKKLISSHLLDLHVVENHDSYFQLQKDKKPMVSSIKNI